MGRKTLIGFQRSMNGYYIFKKNFLIGNTFNQRHLCLKYFRDTFFDLCFIGPVGFDDHLTDASLASTFFASAIFGGGCCDGAYQQIVKKIIQKKLCVTYDDLGHGFPARAWHWGGPVPTVSSGSKKSPFWTNPLKVFLWTI